MLVIQGSLFDQTETETSPLANKMKDMKKLKSQKSMTSTLDRMAFEAGKNKSLAKYNRMNKESMGTLFKDAMLIKMSSQALIHKREIQRQRESKMDHDSKERDPTEPEDETFKTSIIE